MISFRYHLVTIVAVFVALAVGILIGGTLLNADFESAAEGSGRFVQQARGRTPQADVGPVRVGQGREPVRGPGRTVADPGPSVTGRPAHGRDRDGDGVDPRERWPASARPWPRRARRWGAVVLSPVAPTPAEPRRRRPRLRRRPDPRRELASETAKALAHRLVDGAPAAGTAARRTTRSRRWPERGFVSVTDAAKGGAKAIGGPGQSVVLSGGGAAPAVDDPAVHSTVPADAGGRRAAVCRRRGLHRARRPVLPVDRARGRCPGRQHRHGGQRGSGVGSVSRWSSVWRT